MTILFIYTYIHL